MQTESPVFLRFGGDHVHGDTEVVYLMTADILLNEERTAEMKRMINLLQIRLRSILADLLLWEAYLLLPNAKAMVYNGCLLLLSTLKERGFAFADWERRGPRR